MKLHRLIIALLASCLFWPLAATAGTQDFTIPTFTADYYLSRDSAHISHLRVHEHLVAKFPDFDQNHGLLRAIPETYQNHPTGLKLTSVTDDTGANLPYTTSHSNHNLVLKIGDAHRYVHGLQSYNLDYALDNVTTGVTGYDGFFWDANGDAWQQEFGQVTANVHLTSDIAAAIQPAAARCFTGPPGSTATACTTVAAAGPDGETITTYTATRALGAGETLTLEQRFAPGTFAAYHEPLTQTLINLAFIGLLVILPVPLTIAIMLRRWLRYGRDPEGRGVIVPQYLPPKDLSVLDASAILTESFQPKAISATILDLAVRGYLKIYETTQARLIGAKTSYDIELVKAPGNLRADEQAVLQLILSNQLTPGTRVNLSSLRNKLSAGATAIGRTVNQRLAHTGYFRVDPAKAKTPYLIIAGVIGAVSFFFLPASIMLLISAGIIAIFSQIMPARTATGVERREYLLGLKMFISVAEAERIKALQAPHGKLTEKIDVTDTTTLVKLYEKLLPYAMLFGLEKDWARQFAALYSQPPDWYGGASSFNAVYFASSLAGFSSAASASFTAPSSSGSGGFAGGGGGGGGGGGW
ncbi:MAG TPA: DUF2207 domain-containing protein [Candidatus Saccharimonadia bacterium]|nr:DUF2207 domain-containing protein [Candidatus Saccharimonadia bacterium]